MYFSFIYIIALLQTKKAVQKKKKKNSDEGVKAELGECTSPPMYPAGSPSVLRGAF